MAASRPDAPDQAERDRIETALSESLIVEAAAGSGKTRMLCRRAVALVRDAAVPVRELAAVTFTRKAAGELRQRLARELEEALARERDPEKAGRLARAREELPQAFLGTIHAFAARLLRERPVEAGIDPEFAEIDEAEAASLTAEIWHEHLERLAFDGAPALSALLEADLRPEELGQTFARLAEHPDVAIPAEEAPVPDFSPAVGRTLALLDEAEPLLRRIGEGASVDEFSERLWRAIYWRRTADLARPEECARLLEILDAGARLTAGAWGELSEEARALKETHEALREEALSPALARWHEHRYPIAMAVLRPASEELRRIRRERACPTFTDLLVLARDLLRDHPEVRRGLHARYPRLLVDEFQDTDPIQAQILLYLSSENPEERDWRRCRPIPGSLFVVGDPKQSIYRFRRADIATYEEFARLVEKAGGRKVPLTASFRSVPEICRFVNAALAPLFGASPRQARYVPLAATRGSSGGLSGVFRYEIASEGNSADPVFRRDAGEIAARIAGAIADGSRRAGDFLVLLRDAKRLHLYAQALEARGVPCEVTGGRSLKDSEELAALLPPLQALADPDNPMPLIAYLRGPLCGVDDPALYRFRRADGRFRYLDEPPPSADPRIARALASLREAHEEVRLLSPGAAIARWLSRSGLLPQALTRETGNIRAGNLAKLLSRARRLSQEGRPFPEVVEELSRLREAEREAEGEIAPGRPDAVRVMNLHQAKGLEAPVVFLAGPYEGGNRRHTVELAVDRTSDPPAARFLVEFRENVRVTRLLAQPAGWSAVEEAERLEREAEEDRLLYVAATRAADALIVGYQRKKDGTLQGPWKRLAEAIAAELPPESAAALAAPPPRALPEPGRARAEIERKRLFAQHPGWSVVTPSGMAKTPSEAAAAESGPGGAAFGRLLHALLEAAMEGPEAELALLGANLARSEELGAEAAEEALRIVGAVRESELWRRARASAERYVEVPVGVELSREEAGLPDGAPRALVSGVIDLVFREAGRWVIVDYKSDAREEPERYAPQLALYRRAWERIAGGPVSSHLFFVRSGRLVDTA